MCPRNWYSNFTSQGIPYSKSLYFGHANIPGRLGGVTEGVIYTQPSRCVFVYVALTISDLADVSCVLSGTSTTNTKHKYRL
jgi:hypothetical protein